MTKNKRSESGERDQILDLETPACPPAYRGREQSLPGMGEASKPRRMSFREAITKAEDQICFGEIGRDHPNYGILHDMCRVMAEVYMMPPRALIRINGEDLEAGMVAEVLAEVTQEMAEERAEELRAALPGVICLKAYLRSALYNKVFEFGTAEAKMSEQVKRDMGWV